jgi:hypothetical protein
MQTDPIPIIPTDDSEQQTDSKVLFDNDTQTQSTPHFDIDIQTDHPNQYDHQTQTPVVHMYDFCHQTENLTLLFNSKSCDTQTSTKPSHDYST